LKIACLQTEPKRSIKEALDEALDLASLAKNEDVNFLFLPNYILLLQIKKINIYFFKS